MGGFLVAMGIGLSVYATQLVIANLTTKEGLIKAGMIMEVYKDLDPTKNQNGVFVIQIDNFQDNNKITASIVDPQGNVVITKSIGISPFQESFRISSAGAYKLLIKNSAEKETYLIAVIGYLPQDESLTVSIFSVVVIIIGLVGLATGTLYFIKNRRQSSVS